MDLLSQKKQWLRLLAFLFGLLTTLVSSGWQPAFGFSAPEVVQPAITQQPFSLSATNLMNGDGADEVTASHRAPNFYQ